MATAVNALYIGDSRTQGRGDASLYDFLAIPTAQSFGSNVTSLPTGTLTPPSGGTDGSGARLVVDFFRDTSGNPVNGAMIATFDDGGSGYNNPAKLPTITFTGGNGTTGSYTVQQGGGWFRLVRAALIAGGVNVKCINGGFGGAGIVDLFGGGGGTAFNFVLDALGKRTPFVVFLDVGVNDAGGGRSVASYQSLLQQFVTYWVAQGAALIVIDKPWGVPTAGPGTVLSNAATINTLIQGYGGAIDAVIAANPGVCVAGANLYPVALGQNTWYDDGIHFNSNGGNQAVAAPKVASHLPILARLYGTLPVIGVGAAPVPTISRAQATALIALGEEILWNGVIYTSAAALPPAFV